MNPSRRARQKLLIAVSVVISLAASAEQQPGNPPITPGKDCSRTCGNVSIPFPFGVEAGCYLPGFQVICEKTLYPPRPFLDGTNATLGRSYYKREESSFDAQVEDYVTWPRMELKEVSVEQGEARMWVTQGSNCPANDTHNLFLRAYLHVASPFLISRRNVLIGIGLNTNSTLITEMNDTDGVDANSCVSQVPHWKRPEDGPACTGKGCCEAASSQVLGHSATIFLDLVNSKLPLYPNDTACSLGMLVEKGWYNFTVGDAYGDQDYMDNRFPRGALLVLDFAIREGACPSPQGHRPPNNYACISGNSDCIGATDGHGYRCRCSKGYQGNPYIADGCQDINECLDKNICKGDHLECKNKPGGHDCVCNGGWRMRGNETCVDPFPLPAKVAVGTVLLAAAFICFTCCIRWIRNHRKDKLRLCDRLKVNVQQDEELEWGIEQSNSEFTVFHFSQVSEATKVFSEENKLGQGGFGPVYKGQFVDGLEIAVKRLASCSGQGLREFKNEVQLIAKLQHRNLVRLLGCCSQGEDKMLVYEYLPNKSLDFFIFDETRRTLLGWNKHLMIIEGIAQGLLYLHKHSRLRVVHRDIKASNVLLDSEMNPKISDFGLARMFSSDDTDGNTKRVVGTYGYMAPEYASEGLFSTKSDVFSFGVMILEIVTGKRNSRFNQHEDFLNLLGYAWQLWREGRWLELVDASLVAESHHTSEIIRCINIALLCVQETADDRPTMSDVVVMLSSTSMILPEPKQPAYFHVRVAREETSTVDEPCSANDVTISSPRGR